MINCINLTKPTLFIFKEKEGKDSDSEFEPDSSEDFPCLCDSCPEEAIKDKNCCQYFAKTKLDCDSGDVDCVLKLPKFLKMMDAVRRIIISQNENIPLQDVLEFTLHCYYDTLRINYSSPPENR